MVRTRILLVTGAMLLIVALAAGLYTLDVAGIRSRVEAQLALHGVRVVEGPLETRAVYEYDWFGNRHAVTLPVSGVLVDYARNGEREAALVGNLQTREMGIVLLGSMPRTLLNDGQIKSTIDISADGTYIAYAVLTDSGAELPSDPADFYTPARWRVRVLNVESGFERELGTGYAPRFFERDGEEYVVISDTQSLRIVPVEGDGETAIPTGRNDGRWPVEVADDGDYVAVYDADDESHSYTLYRLTHDGTWTMEKARAFTEQMFRVGIRDGHLIAAGVVNGRPPSISSFVVNLRNANLPVTRADNMPVPGPNRILP